VPHGGGSGRLSRIAEPGQICTGGSDPNPLHFTGDEGDSEDNLDLSNPQSLNLYAYVVNNPANLIDPLGLSDCNGEPCTGPFGGGQPVLTCGFFSEPSAN